ncbi:MAG: GntG family PLP-dependent aldolase [Bacteroidota bacterium]
MIKKINLVSDTVTKPTPEMLEYMMQAEVGDDVFREDPTINKLESKVARMFGKEAALFTPSGTMANQIAIKIHTQPGNQVICDKTAHIYNYENGGIAVNSGCSVKLADGDRGRFTANDINNLLQVNGPYYMQESALVSVENTTNLGGGATWDYKEIENISNVCKENNLPFHLDGARLFNALIANKETPKQYGDVFDTISICISKGLGAPVGSVLMGSNKDILKALRIRKLMGGGMRQAGYLAAACIYALDNNVDRLKDDHKRAKTLGNTLKNLNYIKSVLDVETNIVIFELKDGVSQKKFMSELNKNNIYIVSMGGSKLRMTTHLDFNDDDLDIVVKVLKNITL